MSNNHKNSVEAWVNIGGVLCGSILAGKALRWPQCRYVKLFVLGSGSFEGIESLTTIRCTGCFDGLKLSDHVLIVNHVGIPLSGQVSDRARLGYCYLRREGPNNGLTLMTEQIPPRSLTIAELRLDHFYLDPEIHLKTASGSGSDSAYWGTFICSIMEPNPTTQWTAQAHATRPQSHW